MTFCFYLGKKKQSQAHTAEIIKNAKIENRK
jgi:hypothetical protein